MKSLPLDSKNIDAIYNRLAKIRPDQPRQWGSLTPAGLVRHLRFVVEMSLGDHEVEDKSRFPFTNPLFRKIFIEMMPWPKTIKGPDYITPEPQGEIDSELKGLREVMERFVKEAEARPDDRGPHPAFGPLTLKYYQKLHGLHIAHHFRQFGL